MSTRLSGLPELDETPDFPHPEQATMSEALCRKLVWSALHAADREVERRGGQDILVGMVVDSGAELPPIAEWRRQPLYGTDFDALWCLAINITVPESYEELPELWSMIRLKKALLGEDPEETQKDFAVVLLKGIAQFQRVHGCVWVSEAWMKCIKDVPEGEKLKQASKYADRTEILLVTLEIPGAVYQAMVEIFTPIPYQGQKRTTDVHGTKERDIKRLPLSGMMGRLQRILRENQDVENWTEFEEIQEKIKAGDFGDGARGRGGEKARATNGGDDDYFPDFAEGARVALEFARAHPMNTFSRDGVRFYQSDLCGERVAIGVSLFAEKVDKHLIPGIANKLIVSMSIFEGPNMPPVKTPTDEMKEMVRLLFFGVNRVEVLSSPAYGDKVYKVMGEAA